YRGFWGVSNIEIRKIYPVEEENICSLQNYPRCNTIRIRDVKIEVEHSSFIALCRKDLIEGQSYDKCELAIAMVAY
ncbi:hypothetical protein ACFL0X_02550, partial [Nanoarchaeota archaeon]